MTDFGGHRDNAQSEAQHLRHRRQSNLQAVDRWLRFRLGELLRQRSERKCAQDRAQREEADRHRQPFGPFQLDPRHLVVVEQRDDPADAAGRERQQLLDDAFGELERVGYSSPPDQGQPSEASACRFWMAASTCSAMT